MVAATLVEELGQPALRYFVLWLQSTLALIEGLFEDAEKLAHESFELGVSANHPDAAVVYGTQLVVFAWQRGDTTALVEPTLDILTRVPDLPAWRSALALVLALGGRPDDARAELLRVTQSLDNLTFTSTWTPALIGLTEVARQLDEPSVAARLYEGLAAYPDRMSVISLSLSEMGPISRALGVLAGLQGDHAVAERHFAEALAICERIGSPPHTTRTPGGAGAGAARPARRRRRRSRPRAARRGAAGGARARHGRRAARHPPAQECGELGASDS